MRICIAVITTLVYFVVFHVRAEDADDLRAKGVADLKESQTNPRAIVEAARHFVKAAELFAAACERWNAV